MRLVRRGTAGVLALAAAGLLACRPADPAPPEVRPDVVAVLIDTFRPDHLGVNGHARSTAPFLESLMERSTVFDQAFSTSSWTAPATGSLFTGLYPSRHGVTEGFVAHKQRSAALEELVGESIALNRLPSDVATLSELLRQAGYQTLGVASNINIGAEIGFDRGFDRFVKIRDGSARELADRLSQWWSESDAERPRFAYLHFNDVHKPYEPRSPWFEESDDELARDVSAYDSEISYLDQVLKSLYRDLDWAHGTLFVALSDHGEEFHEHGQLGHRFSLYDELMRVLMVYSGGDLGIPAQRVSAPASLIDVLPTVLEAVGVAGPKDRDGRSLARYLRAEPPAAVDDDLRSRTLFAHRVQRRASEGREEHLWAALRPPWKLVVSPDGSPRLYHLERDPEERNDVAEAQPRQVLGLAAELDAVRDAVRAPGEQVEVEMDRETLEALESLGYVQ